LLLHFLVSTTMAAVICSSFTPTMSAASTTLVYAMCAPWSISHPLPWSRG
jgi:hypothetical protein